MTSPVNSITLFSLIRSFLQNYQLVKQMTKRDVLGRYKGSFLGLGWSFFNPILMLVVYAFVFSVVFKARWWTGDVDSHTTFAIPLFVGMIVHGLFAECANRAAALIMENTNYVKKVVFPLEILPWVVMGSALFHLLISLIVLLLVQLAIFQSLQWTVILFPVVLMPLVFFSVGVIWFLSSIGVFLRDVGPTVSVITAALLFISPVFYPLSALPEKYQFWVKFNPLAFIIEEARNSLVFGEVPNWLDWGIYMGLSILTCWFGFWWFQRTRKGFADVL